MLEFLPLASGSTGNAYRLDDGHSPLLLEAGIPIKRIKQGLGFRLKEIQACLISHCHLDHAKSASEVMAAGVDCYMSRESADILGLEGHRLHIVRPREQIKIGAWVVLPFETQHDCEGSLGFLLSNGRHKLLFATDTYYVKYRFRGLTHIAVECNYATDILEANIAAGGVSPAMRKRLLHSHFSLENVKGFLRANDLSQVQEIWLLHLSDNNSDEERFRREIMELTGKPVYVAK